MLGLNSLSCTDLTTFRETGASTAVRSLVDWEENAVAVDRKKILQQAPPQHMYNHQSESKCSFQALVRSLEAQPARRTNKQQ